MQGIKKWDKYIQYNNIYILPNQMYVFMYVYYIFGQICHVDI